MRRWVQWSVDVLLTRIVFFSRSWGGAASQVQYTVLLQRISAPAVLHMGVHCTAQLVQDGTSCLQVQGEGGCAAHIRLGWRQQHACICRVLWPAQGRSITWVSQWGRSHMQYQPEASYLPCRALNQHVCYVSSSCPHRSQSQRSSHHLAKQQVQQAASPAASTPMHPTSDGRQQQQRVPQP